MLGSDDGVGHAEGGVRPGREDPDGQRGTAVAAVPPLDAEVELGSLRAPDPVPLHGLDPLGPFEGLEVGQELVGVVGDPEEPLLQVALLDEVAGTLTGPVRQHLLVGQHRLAAGAPVDRGLGPVGETGGQERQEDDLVPLDVLRVVAADLPPPVVDGPERGDRLLQLGDAGLGEHPGVGARLDGGVFRRQAEGVEPERGEDGVPQHGPMTDQQVTEGVVADVAHVRRARRVRVHAEHVPGRTGIGGIDLVGALVGPALLPLLLHLDGRRRPGPWLTMVPGTELGPPRGDLLGAWSGGPFGWRRGPPNLAPAGEPASGSGYANRRRPSGAHREP